MTPKRTPPKQEVDPGILEIIGAVAELLGLAEHIQRVLPLDRFRMATRHRRIEKLLEQFRKALEDARAAMRIISSSVASSSVWSAVDTPEDTIGFPLDRNELPVFRRGLDQLHVAIRSMTNAALELEAVTAGMPEEVQRYHRISANGRVVLEKLRNAIQEPPRRLPLLLEETERYLTKCSEMVAEATHWRGL